ncbi:MAG: alpha/beta fold hydrolase [Clostridia bacterium]
MSRAVILFHGFITDKDDFGNLPKLLEPLYDKVYCFTFPGHGKNPDYSKFTVDATFEKVLRKFDKLKSEYDVVDVIGFSMGGAVATYLTTVREVGKLVLLAPANKFLNPAMPFASGIFWFNKISEAISKVAGGENLKKVYKDTLATYMENEKITVDMAIKRLIPNYTYKTLSTFNKIIKKCNANLTTIPNEMLVVWGKLDQLVPIDSPHWLMSICTNENKKFLELNDISHLMLASKNADYVMNEIVAFLKVSNVEMANNERIVELENANNESIERVEKEENERKNIPII